MVVFDRSMNEDLSSDLLSAGDGPHETTRDQQQEAFLSFYDRYSPKVYAYARSRNFAEESAADIVQKVFEIAWRRFGETSEVASLDLWILRITENTCRYEYRKFWRRQEVLVSENTEIDKLTVNPADKGRYLESPLERRVLEDELYENLEKFVANLPKKQREVFQMRMNGITYEEIGFALRISSEAARRRMMRAIATGKELFGEFSQLLG